MIRLAPERDAANQNFLLLETVEENENAVTKEEGFGTETLSLMEKQGFPQPSDIREEPPSTEFCTFARVMGLPLLFKGINIIAWYWTNGMNGISMQSFSVEVDKTTIRSPDSGLLDFIIILEVTAITTCLQLFVGSIIGRILLLTLNRKITWHHILATHSWRLSGLHALGSLATNLGFMYGKASLVQVVKLLEPFETLVLSQIFFREGSKCSIGIVSSMITVVGAAMSLMKIQMKPPPHPLSIAFAIVSGLSLSCRNVIQRKQHHQTSMGAASLDTPASPGVSSRMGKPFPPTTMTASSTTNLSALEKSLIQFTQLSVFSALWIGPMFLFLYGAVNSILPLGSLTLFLAQHPGSLTLFVWHPLYNVFSMITLGFCSALTHALLNAGKRVFAIVMAILWFGEGLNAATLAGLLGVLVGGTWYGLESKRAQTGPTLKRLCGHRRRNLPPLLSISDCQKLAGSLLSVGVLLGYQSF